MNVHFIRGSRPRRLGTGRFVAVKGDFVASGSRQCKAPSPRAQQTGRLEGTSARRHAGMPVRMPVDRRACASRRCRVFEALEVSGVTKHRPPGYALDREQHGFAGCDNPDRRSASKSGAQLLGVGPPLGMEPGSLRRTCTASGSSCWVNRAGESAPAKQQALALRAREPEEE